MTGSIRRKCALAACVAATLASAACMLNGESRTAQGQLYTSGNATYDSFFREVHQQQVDAASWGDDKKGAHKSLVSALELTPDAADVTIVQATHESSSKLAKQPGTLHLDVDGTAVHVVASGGAGDGGALFRAIEDSAHQELERAKRLRAVQPKLEALAKQDSDMEARVKADFAQYGETKENEVAGELIAIHDVIAKLRARAESEARESEDFVADLGRAIDTASEDKAIHADAHKRKKRDDGAAPPKGAPSTSDQAVAAPKPAATTPKPADTGEVFTP
jgi:hypothetical protein